ncbi:hypothetical protein B0T25DRAFT_566777 [Lasiosphaeria hispida]|uniref:LPXTG-motif cell wall anchor domain-containing protein n=1 Tax=Lasiosphaeria hispida TaxID=260671 RepID=A0AAJ0MG86_9PEZI|nr:hypothetical protein B0T25DRAFT_566777 [Lasiosphaeria hispida]
MTMTPSNFASDAGHGPHSTAASYSTAPAAHPPHSKLSNNSNSGTAGNSSSNSSSNDKNSIFEAHRQNHNSSKLPAFRFADLKKDAIVLPTLLQHAAQTAVSPQSTQDVNAVSDRPECPADGVLDQRDAHNPTQQSQHVPGSGLHHNYNLHNHSHTVAQNLPDKSASTPETPQLAAPFPQQPSPPRTRASTFHNPPAATTTTTNSISTSTPASNPTPKGKSDPSTGSKRPASFPDTPIIATNAYATRNQSSSTANPIAKRRLTASAVTTGAGGTEILTSHRSLSTHLQTSQATHPGEHSNSTKEWAQGQRELLLPKTIETAKSDDKRRSRPPVSYRPPTVAASASGGRIPPIRSFRSSGSRKSLNLDMHVRRGSEDSYGEEITDPNQRDRTLRALEGRVDDDFSHVTPPDSSVDAAQDDDNTADLFMSIAREDSPVKRAPDERETAVEQSAISRITRASHRRPLSAAVPTYQATSPPQITRRLSDQRENTRARQPADSQPAQHMTRELGHRASVREKPIITTAATEDSGRSQPLRTPLKPSPITPRQISFQDVSPERGVAYRRRQSVTESNSGFSINKTSQYRNANLALSHGRTYNSSPLVPKALDFQKHEPQQSSEANHAVEGTESSASTAAPSTVWDELDDLKSRIHRLELTGKTPSTSGAAMSRASDDRPPTATTNATTMSASPKRGSGTGAAQPDASSTTSSQRESQPILLSALSKTRTLISPEVFGAIEAAATDALALSSMMGAPGQPGPISSGASTIGVGGSLTDRQLRRKAESICRSLTELCIALADETGPAKVPQLPPPVPREKERELLASPTSKLAPTPRQRQPSTYVTTETAVSKPIMSPRAPTSLEQRRLTMLASTTLPSPRFALAPSTQMEPSSAGRKSSLLLARTRRAGTEEPEEMSGRRSSLLLRSRRAGTEEPEESREGRKTSMLLRSRKATNEDDEEPRFRAPSRAITEVVSFRGAAPRDFNPQSQASPPDANSLGSSALPRRRLVPSSLNPRLITPSGPAAAPPNRRYLDRATPERESNSVAEKLAEDRGQRQFSLSQTAMLNRTGSVSRRNRDSSIPSLPPQNTQGGGYR